VRLERTFTGSAGKLMFSHHNGKLGRGSAIRRGMDLSLKTFPNLIYFLECDADGSHRVPDIITVRDYPKDCDLLIGSRYLPSSEIIGWPMKRRIFSAWLNFAIPRILGIPIKDVTNGLRRYSVRSIKVILSKVQLNKGFTFLSEQAVTLANEGFQIEEIPIVFKERTLGNSTVTWREIAASCWGITRILFTTRRSRF
jgi:dolichol-phosphate mannosyltransferase